MKHALTDYDLLHLTQEQARDIYRQGPEAVTWALLKLSVLAQGGDKSAASLSTPSSQIPAYEKPAAKRGHKKRGRKPGHKGARRRPPLAIDRQEEHKLGRCPDCGGPVSKPYAERRRVIEDIEKTTVVTTEHTIHSHYCPRCKKRVEPRVVDALPKSTIGNRALALSSWLHYGLGQTTSQIVSVFDSLFHFPTTAGGLVQQWHRLGEILAPWYDAIANQARDSAVLNVDETGWRVDGKTHWLWCFTTPQLTYYHIDPTRSGDVLDEFLADCFEGTLVSDFFSAYNVVTGQRQLCLVHLLRELKKVGEVNTSEEWITFHRKLKRVLRDALRLAQRPDRETSDPGTEPTDAPSADQRRVNRIHLRLDKLISHTEWTDPDCRRLVKRLEKHRYSLFTFLDRPEVPADNNRAERELRPAVIARKNFFQNASRRGAQTQAILMSVYRTLKLRGHDPIETLADALATSIATGALPTMPRAP
jgi:transposase